MDSVPRSLWWLATCLWCLATLPAQEEGVALVGGPWVVLRGDGSLRVAAELPARVDPLLLGLVVIRGASGTVLATVNEAVSIQRPLLPPATLIHFDLAPEAALQAPANLELGGGRRVPVHLPRHPAVGAEAAVAFAGGWNWPTASDLERLGRALGRPVEAVVVLGRDWQQRLGRGGWEHRVPLLVPAAGDQPLVASLVGADDDWSTGIRWGRLGLPLVDDHETAAWAIARDLSPWQVPIETVATWRIGRLRAAAAASPHQLAMLVDACVQRRLPLVLAGGGGAGFLSEPLQMAGDGRVRVAAPGVRYLAATPAGFAAASLDGHIALPLDQRALIGLAASDRLRLAWVPLGGGEATSLDFTPLRPADPLAPSPPPLNAAASTYARPEPAWGIGEPGSLLATWLGPETFSAAEPIADLSAEEALRRLAWLPVTRLAVLAPGSTELRTLLGILKGRPDADLLLRRLSALDALIVNEWAVATGGVGEAVRRDLILRSLDQPEAVREPALAALVRTSQDQELLASIVHAARQQRSRPLLLALRDRFAAQAAGALPFDPEPVLQHEIAGLVFESPYLSPTPLRPLALALRERLGPLAQGPIERFLARHGAVRPVP